MTQVPVLDSVGPGSLLTGPAQPAHTDMLFLMVIQTRTLNRALERLSS